jgi:prevent-host-death family protein
MVMNKVNVFEIKAKLSEYLDRAARGERIVICRHNKPVAELRAISEAQTKPRTIGPLPGRPTFDVPASFFEPLSSEELDQWEGISGSDPLPRASTGSSSRGASRVAESKTGYGRAQRGARPPRRRS